MVNLLSSLYSLIDNSYFLLGATLLAFCFKVVILTLLVVKSLQSTKNERPWTLLAIITLCATFIDFSWLLHLFRSLFADNYYKITLITIRLAWIAIILLYQTLGVFIERIASNKPKIRFHQKIFCNISLFLIFVLLIFAIKDFNCVSNEERSIYEMLARNIAGAFGLFVSFFSCLFTIKEIRHQNLPRLLKKQLKILIQLLIAPIWISDFLQLFPLVCSTTWITNSYAAASISTMLITYALYHCMRKVMALRFLNLKSSVETISRFNFIDGFKDILEQLSHATTMHELSHITQSCFKEAFNIPTGRTHLYIRAHQNERNTMRHEPFSIIESTIEKFITSYDEATVQYIKKLKILTFDEIAFSNFYERTDERTIVLRFLEQINADIFIPIYEKDNMLGYIIVDRYARPQEFYGSVEQDEMQVFASYLGNIINLIQNRNLETLIHREKELQEELYDKHQEINQYKESIRSFLTTNKQKDIGIIFFKNRRFSFGNQAAKELINVNINVQHGHPTSKALRTITRHVQEYKTPKSTIIKDIKDQKLVLAGVPSIESNTVIITVYHPDISDLIKHQATALRDPSKWDYLLYLETTQSGKLINQLLPGTGEMLLQAKITLLKAALSKKAILLEIAQDDLMPTVELLHHISLRETLHVLKLQSPIKNYDTAIKLFGINPIFDAKQQTTPLLEKLDNTGTLFIQNVHYLNLETQEYFAEYLKYGSWRVFKSEQRLKSNVRIICSTNQNLSALVQDGVFLKELYTELKKNSIIMPSLLTLPEDELHELTQGYAEQAIAKDEFKDLLELNDREKSHIVHQRPISFHELKNKIQQILAKKTRKNHIQDEITFDHTYASGDPEVIQAIRLGKHALRDPKIMNVLWSKFKNQTKIASLLGVNRSSVNRRCKDYKLE